MKQKKFEHTQAIIDLTNAIHSWRDEIRFPSRWYHRLPRLHGLVKIFLFAAIGGGIGGVVGYAVGSAAFVVLTSR